jgi:predicted metal-dependent RNase
MTKPTRDLIGVLLADYQRIQASKHEGKRLFGSKDVEDVMRDANIMEYLETFKADFNVTFHPAGHIMGSAMTMIEHGHKKILFSGDICTRKTRVLDPCERGLHCDTLIVENTYGSKEDIVPSYKESYQKMITIIKETIDKGGHVIIPSFAVGRAQEVLLALDDYMRSGAIPQTKIFIDGMIGKAMKIYRHNAIYANDDIKRRILMSEDDPFKSPNFHHPRSKTKEDVLKEPCIIVTTSGMLSGGPVLSYLEKLGGDPKNALIFVGYQAEGTTGNKVLQGENGRKINIYGNEVELKLRVESIRLSGHADFNELIQFIGSIKGLKKVFLMHGEKTELKDAIEHKYDTVVPRQLDTYSV